LEVLLADGLSSHIFSFADLKWRDGPHIPDSRISVSSAQIKNGFVAVGGYDNEITKEYVKAIYRFDDTLYDWVLEEAELEIARDFTATVSVPDNFANCQ